MDKQWRGFEHGKSERPRGSDVQFGRAGRIIVEVDRERNETVVRLDVDGWPRAIRRKIRHQEGATEKTAKGFKSIQFRSVKIDYPEPAPINNPDDLPVASTEVFFPDPDSGVFFRGGAKSLKTLLNVDVPIALYERDRSKWPEIQVKDCLLYTSPSPRD